MQAALATKRLRKEYQMLMRNPVPFIIAKPNMKNILEWHYVLFPPEDSLYEGGVYHGVLKFPAEFPHKPPSIIMCTPSGRFQPEARLCLSISDFHPESWNPMWSVSSILTGLLSFMLEDKQTHGSIVTTDYEKKKIAKLTMTYNKKNPPFIANFPELLDPEMLNKIRTESLKPIPKPQSQEPLTLLKDSEIASDTESLESTNSNNQLQSTNTKAKEAEVKNASVVPLLFILFALLIVFLNQYL